jgi:HK97 family phage prohead protease
MQRETASDLADVVRALGPSDVKLARAVITKAPTDGSGTFQALVSTFGGEPDTDGDVIAEGAFAETISTAYARRLERKGTNLWPVFWQHRYGDPRNAIGGVTAATEAPEGLLIEGKLDLSNPTAVDVYEGMLADRIREWSIGYAVVRATKRGDGVRVLHEVELLEVSAVVAGANRNTRTLAVKAPAPAPAPVPVPVAQHLYLYHDVPGPGLRTLTAREYRDVHARLHRLEIARVPHACDDLAVAAPGNRSLDELAEYKRRIAEVEGTATRPTSDAEVRAVVNRLYDEHVLAAKLEQLKADEAIFGARIRRREREERQRAIKRTEAPR